MSFQAPISVADAISRIHDRRLLLPAIQREFVWTPDKVEWLFDSLLQGYPVGSFLFWQVQDPTVKSGYKFYEFLQQYRERYRTHNPEFNAAGHRDFDAVLDGQQRLTSLYIGLTGTYAYKRARVWWEDTESALPTRKLYLNVLCQAPEDDDEETGRMYEFRFLTQEEFDVEPEKWFRVERILTLVGAFEFNQMLKQDGYQDNEFSARALSRLHSVTHIERSINYYWIQSSDMELALNVFVRVNSGGEPLSLSDMLMSTAVANWKTKDARKEVLGLVDQIRGIGFFIDKDLILKSCLYLYSSDIRYRVTNFSASQVKPFEENWDGIRDAIRAVFELVQAFGYSESSLTSKNALLPIIYWVHHKGLAGTIQSQVNLRDERGSMRRWLHTMLLKGVFGTHADTILAAIRKAFTGDEFGSSYIKSTVAQFPREEIGLILRAQGKDPEVSDEFIDSLLYTQYEERQAFTILALLAPNLDYKNGDFHKDHLHPKSKFGRRKLMAAGVKEEDMEFYRDSKNWNSILNLRHLDAAENKSKNNTDLAVWAASEADRQRISQEKFCLNHQLPTPSDLQFGNFPVYIEKRRELLAKALRELLQ